MKHIIVTIVATAIGFFFGFCAGTGNQRTTAVREGAATWVNDIDGTPKFQWIKNGKGNTP